MLLKGKTAVITGCNRGIGKKILETFSEHGATIFACVRNIDNEFTVFLNSLTDKYNNQIVPIKFDLANNDEIKEASSTIINSKKNIDILINNAATIHTAIFQMTSVKKLKEIFDINFFSQSVFTQYILKSMVKNKKGSIIYVSSSSALDGNEGRSAYSAAKSALLTQSKVLSREIGIHNIRVNAIAPGLTDTDMMKKNTDEKTIKDVLSRVSLRRMARPEEIAGSTLFLASDLSSYITGQVLRVDGGM